MGRMDKPQLFFGFVDSTKSSKVEIVGDLHLATIDKGFGSYDLPPILVRMVPGQVDDLLIAGPDLDRLGFNSDDPEFFLLKNVVCRFLGRHRWLGLIHPLSIVILPV